MYKSALVALVQKSVKEQESVSPLTMSRAIFALFVIGVLFSMTIAQCPVNQEWDPCGSACPPTCDSPLKRCTKQCVPGCFCKQGLLFNAAGQCVFPQAC